MCLTEQTGAGKTFTVVGEGERGGERGSVGVGVGVGVGVHIGSEHDGLLGRCLQYLFTQQQLLLKQQVELF